VPYHLSHQQSLTPKSFEQLNELFATAERNRDSCSEIVDGENGPNEAPLWFKIQIWMHNLQVSSCIVTDFPGLKDLF
jgi:hypothetical protein